MAAARGRFPTPPAPFPAPWPPSNPREGGEALTGAGRPALLVPRPPANPRDGEETLAGAGRPALPVPWPLANPREGGEAMAGARRPGASAPSRLCGLGGEAMAGAGRFALPVPLHPCGPAEGGEAAATAGHPEAAEPRRLASPNEERRAPASTALPPFSAVGGGARAQGRGARGVRALFAALMLVICAGRATGEDAGAGTVLLNETFEAAEPGSQPVSWLYFTDAGNNVVVAGAPLTGGRCLKFTRSAGTVWKPMVSGGVAGHAQSPVRLECDFYLPEGPAEGALSVTLRGEGNIHTVSVTLGGPAGVAVPQGNREWVPLGFPLRAGRWGHLSITADPFARKGKGAFDLVVSQGKERLECPNIPFQPNHRGDYGGVLWHSPVFQVSGGAPGAPREALVDNVRVVISPPRDHD